MEAPFYPEEGLELLPDFVPLPAFASKCRRRKLERIARLEEKVKALKGQNAELAATANLLRAQVTQLQGRVRSHLSSGCHINAAGHPPPAAAQPREAPPEAVAAPETSAC
ncbi:hypothetical protein Q9233_007800 [Columba guinea]|nr:hypothetical protein Q9233_007800 [Columba guinea]